MLALAIAILFLMAVCNYLFSRKLLYPPVVFCFVWAADLIIVWMAGDFFYRIGNALLLFVLGALAFSLGGLLTYFMPEPSKAENHAARRIWPYVIGLIAAFPFLLRWLSAGADPSQTFLIAARNFMLDVQAEGGDWHFTLFSNLAAFSIPVAMVAFLEWNKFRKRAITAILVSVALNFAIGGRAGVIILFLACFAIHWMRTQKISFRTVASAMIALVLIVGVAGIFMGKTSDAGLTPVIEEAELYSAGGIVGFDRIYSHPTFIEHNWQIDKFPKQVLNALGARYEIPSQHAEFKALGPNHLIGNTYTLYFAYIDLGFLGTLGIMCALGFVCTLVFNRALAGHRISALLYGMLFSGICLSVFAEYFFMGMPFIVRTVAVAWWIYRPTMWVQQTAHKRPLSGSLPPMVSRS